MSGWGAPQQAAAGAGGSGGGKNVTGHSSHNARCQAVLQKPHLRCERRDERRRLRAGRGTLGQRGRLQAALQLLNAQSGSPHIDQELTSGAPSGEQDAPSYSSSNSVGAGGHKRLERCRWRGAVKVSLRLAGAAWAHVPRRRHAARGHHQCVARQRVADRFGPRPTEWLCRSGALQVSNHM